MKALIQQFENTLALCIPDSFARQAHVTPGTMAEISVEDHKLIVLFPDGQQGEEHISLEGLLAGITEENIHGEIETDVPVGNEVW